MQNGEEQGIHPTEDSRKAELSERLSTMELKLADIDLEIRKNEGFKLPLDQIPVLGVAFASLPEAFRTVVGSASSPTLLVVTDKLGNPLDPASLQRFNDGSGLMGSFRDAATGFGQARFHVADPGAITTTTIAPYDPSMLFMAMAFAQINQKLDAIQEAQVEMFSYMREKDKAELRGNVKTLTDILNGYRFNWDNDIWRKNAHMKVMDIKQESEKAIIHLRSQVKGKVNVKGSIEVRFSMEKRMDEVLDRMKEYQIAVYNYSFASFLEPMLCENYSEDYLCAVAEKIWEQTIQYRQFYTACYDVIEGNTKGTVDALLLKGLSSMSKAMGKALAATPIGEHTSLDEALDGAGDGIGKFNDDQSKHLVEKLHQVKVPDTMPFKDSIESINRLYNEPMNLFADSENIYLLPVRSEECEESEEGDNRMNSGEDR